MSDTTFKYAMYVIAAAFTVIFCVLIIPPLIETPDVLGAITAGFVNPYSSGYSTDVIMCWLVLAVWVVYEAKSLSIKYGWVCLLLGIVPGVAVGFPLYLVLRQKQIQQSSKLK